MLAQATAPKTPDPDSAAILDALPRLTPAQRRQLRALAEAMAGSG